MLLGYLYRRCRGRAWARTYARIRQDLAAIGIEVTEREMYALVEALALAGRPVGTTGKGCFVCIEPKDFRAAYRNLYGRLRTQARRCRRFKAMARERTTEQRYLGLRLAAETYEAARDKAERLFQEA